MNALRSAAPAVSDRTIKALDNLSREGLKVACLLNKQTLDEHLDACRVRVSSLETEVHQLRKHEADLNQIVVEIDGHFVTLQQIAKEPDRFLSVHRRCKVAQCLILDPHEHEGRQ